MFPTNTLLTVSSDRSLVRARKNSTDDLFHPPPSPSRVRRTKARPSLIESFDLLCVRSPPSPRTLRQTQPKRRQLRKGHSPSPSAPSTWLACTYVGVHRPLHARRVCVRTVRLLCRCNSLHSDRVRIRIMAATSSSAYGCTYLHHARSTREKKKGRYSTSIHIYGRMSRGNDGRTMEIKPNEKNSHLK